VETIVHPTQVVPHLPTQRFNKHGGKRANSGPVKGSKYLKTRQNRTAQDLLREYLSPHVKEVSDILIEKAKSGDSFAVKEFFERSVGKATDNIDIKIGIAPIPII